VNEARNRDAGIIVWNFKIEIELGSEIDQDK
jgi:hypothetical protein